jgi:dTDP-4-amino-4,6-dideoxygalactose transaminase
MAGDEKIFVTRPFLPPLEEFNVYLKDIWERKWVTNNAYYHRKLERALCDFLDVEYISLFANGSLALVVALQEMRISGEVITTPFSFVATTHSLWWNNIKPVFVDIEPDTFTLDPEKIEAAITPKTTAILPVHVYGNPCKVRQIQDIADTYGLKVIYDAAHAFGVQIEGNSILSFGDLSILSFHATKMFNTFEGGAIVCHDEKTKKRIDFLKNFGFANETTVVAPGINAKMNEIQAAFGLLQLKYFDHCRKQRRRIALTYRKDLANMSGLCFLDDFPGINHNYSYFPVLIDEQKFGMSRDGLYDKLKENNIFSRRYFFPLISHFPTYKNLPSAAPKELPVSEMVAQRILCLPIYPDLSEDDISRVVSIIKEGDQKSIFR